MEEPVMKVLLVAINSKFIHSNLALRYLKAYCGKEHSMDLLEFSINDHIERIIREIYLARPDVVAFSCYIWNIREVLMVADTLKRVMDRCAIVLGGPEVAFDAGDVMRDNPAVDYIVAGEGEETFHELLHILEDKGNPAQVKGLVYRHGRDIVVNPARPLIQDLDMIPFPYQDGFAGLENKVIYYETSRGCPFNCQYCLSSTIPGVRYFSLERVERELALFVKAGIPQVKLVDRTFNCNPARAKHIFKTLISLGGQTNFHFEMAGDLIDDEMLDILGQAPPGLFQFEIGVQSTNPETVHEIQRKMDFDALARAVARLRDNENIHLHLDLIAGLPEEDYASFKRSFNDVYFLRPNRIQLGFLKLLKGSGLRLKAEQYGYEYTQYPPYKVLKNNHITYDEIAKLEMIEDLVEKYYNSGRFKYTLEYLISCHDDNPFEFFERFMAFWKGKGYEGLSYSQIRLYEILLEYGLTLDNVDHRLLTNIMRFDWVSQEKPSRYPEGIEPPQIPGLSKAVDSFFKSEENVLKFMPHLKGYTPRQISRMAHIEVFEYDVVEGVKSGVYPPFITYVLFDYNVGNRIFRRSNFHKVRL
jgi:radical SAM superfamily enzyme YgiQ (UPF0313 family)